jgi:alkanesulfonate monooxygenase SsuD/methylene tetrahydromethanopterin reductase-like flavin-dependent oxidoreductase (luciferase family)
MDISMTLPSMVAGNSRKQTAEWCRRIDAGPYASVAIGERIAFDNPEQLTTLSFAAALTDRVRLVPSIVILPMHAEITIAKQLATLDVLSDGRVTVGVGVGGREEDFVLSGGRSFGGRHGLLDEQVATMQAVWRGETPAGSSRPVGPSPVQPRLPLLSGSLGPKAIARAAVWADGVMGFTLDPLSEDLAGGFERVRGAWADAGRSEAPHLSTTFWYSLEDDGAEVIGRYAHEYLSIFGDDVASSMASLVTSHNEAAVRTALGRLEDAGCDEVFLVPTTHDISALDKLEALLG